MDLYDSDDVSSASSGDHGTDGDDLPEDDRGRNVDSGWRAELRSFSGQCIRDDVSWVRSKVTRVIALQSGGMGANREHWGHYRGRGLSELGGDIGTVAETRMYTEDAQATWPSAMGWVHDVGTVQSSLRRRCS